MAGRQRPDHYALRARKEGYRARSVYKLQEIQRRAHVIRHGGRVLDVGAAPGSWSQLAADLVGSEGLVVAVDISDLDRLKNRNIVTVTGDIFEPTVVSQLEVYAPYDTILSDAAPRTTGNRSLDTTRSAALVEQIIHLSEHMLARGGSFVAKLFQGGDERALLSMVREMYEEARLIKPRASRKESFESFLVGVGFRPRH
jgi:23S rRNA (uridine2552-2'-O)-methyltransferase